MGSNTPAFKTTPVANKSYSRVRAAESARKQHAAPRNASPRHKTGVRICSDEGLPGPGFGLSRRSRVVTRSSNAGPPILPVLKGRTLMMSIGGKTCPFRLRYFSTTAFPPGYLGAHSRSCRGIGACTDRVCVAATLVVHKALPRECGLYFARHERVTPPLQ